MDTGEYLKRYFEQLRNKPITVAAIRDAAAAAYSGDPPTSALDSMLAHAEAYGINPEKELAELHAAR